MTASGSRVAVVTGAARGMGAACARRMLRDGVRVVAFDLREAVIDGALAAVGDITRASDCDAVVQLALERFGRIDILVNAAGVLRPSGLLEMSEQEWDLVVGVNLKGAFLASRAAAAPMVTQGWGRIVHFSSTAGKTVSTLGGSHYTAAKHGVLGLTRALAKELAPHGITVNAVCPGLVDTEMAREAVPAEVLARFAASFPVARLGTAEEVADLVAYLVSDSAGYITGAAIDINGGDFLA